MLFPYGVKPYPHTLSLPRTWNLPKRHIQHTLKVNILRNLCTLKVPFTFQVNGKDMTDLNHTEAIAYLRQTPATVKILFSRSAVFMNQQVCH